MAARSGDVTAVARVAAPAKLTVSLRVLGRRPDGYHELSAEMVSLDLCDALAVDPGGDGVEVTATEGARADALPAGRDNLVVRALEAVGRTAHVNLEKRIPVGGGLGGGSADAAAILRWAGCTDLKVAASLGADVPFCLVGGRALVAGIGEKVTPLPFKGRSFVLLVPPIVVDTAAVYRAWDELAAAKGTRQGRSTCNDLTAAALVAEPRLATWRDAFAQATGQTPSLAGSGSTWWVGGSQEELGLAHRRSLRVGEDAALLIPARAVPAGWNGSGSPI